MLLTLPDDILENVLQRLAFEDQLNLISTQKRLYRQCVVGLEQLQAHVGVYRFYQNMQRHDFSQLKGIPRKRAVAQRRDAQRELLARFDARYTSEGKLSRIREWLLRSRDATERLLGYMDNPRMALSVEDDDEPPGLCLRYCCIYC